ncbi:serine/threonine protein kinase [Nannocystis bainbridge]|uniref:Protein kinase n=1 Tax=Nannocystis bainbridge TaxID=2995303 RepID=A0ABT5E3N6_9BACT|nr:protein kinase [Nannocystis bainbridge]MDC0720484.1 protein kinase [Nannocystis bainbridge]
MPELFPPPLGTVIAGRFELLAPLRGDAAVLTFLVKDSQTGKRRALTLFDPALATATVWAEYHRLWAAAGEAKTSGLTLPPQVPATSPEPPHVVDDPPAHRGLDRLRTQEGRIPWQRALTLGERIAAVLHDAFERTGAVHRALTPSRCTVGEGDTVEVLDFGFAEIELAGEQPEQVEYRAPEQANHKGDSRSDVFSLAAIVYELICGTCPSASPPLLSSLAYVPPAVERLLDRALAADPEQRPADLATMRAALREALGLPALSVSRPATPASPPPTASPAGANDSRLESPSTHRPEPQPVTPSPKPSPVPVSRPLANRAAPHKSVQSPRANLSRQQQATDDPPNDRTARLPPRPAQQDTTLVLSNNEEAPTERVPIFSARPSRPAEPFGERTEVFQKRLNHVPPEERTEKLPASASAPDRTEVLSPSPAGQPSPLPDRTEVLSPRPARESSPPPGRSEPRADPRLAADPRPQPRSPMEGDEERTAVMVRNRGPVIQAPPSSLEPTIGAIRVHRPNPPRQAQASQGDRPSPPSAEPSSPQMPPSNEFLRTTLLKVNLVLVLLLLVGLIVWALA